ncbi:hypothetical protein D3C80_510450 [compost metagenome]
MSVNSDINRILDVFSGVDGGVEFVFLKNNLEGIERRYHADIDDEASRQLLDILHKFRRLVDVLSKTN